MNVQCSGCDTTYRVDPGKVPPTGVRARCSRCDAVFVVSAASGSSAAPASDERQHGQLQQHAVSDAPPRDEVDSGSASVTLTSPAAQAPPEVGVPTGRFGGLDPQTRAQRLARALVSDMVTYHPERHQRGLREGTLRQEFRDEIRKSWEEYVEQIGREMAHGTPYFRDALNQILARGQQVF
jgi:predicted Zn finger-like uncharacterized protein